MYVSPQNFRRYKPPCGDRLTPGIAYLKIAYHQNAGARDIFPARYAGVTNILPMIIYPPLCRYIPDIGVWDLAAPAEKKLPTCRPIFWLLFRLLSQNFHNMVWTIILGHFMLDCPVEVCKIQRFRFFSRRRFDKDDWLTLVMGRPSKTWCVTLHMKRTHMVGIELLTWFRSVKKSERRRLYMTLHKCMITKYLLLH